MSETFSHFPELPKELQIQIWRYAAKPDGSLTIPAKSLRFILENRVYLHGECPYSFNEEKQFLYGEDVHHVGTVNTRAAVGNVCRLARIVMLEAWKQDIEAVSTRNNARGRYKQALIVILDIILE